MSSGMPFPICNHLNLFNLSLCDKRISKLRFNALCYDDTSFCRVHLSGKQCKILLCTLLFFYLNRQ